MTAQGAVMITGGAALTCCGAGYDAFLSALRDEGPAVDEMAGGARRFPPAADAVSARASSEHALVGRLLTTIEHELGDFLVGLSEEARQRTGVAIGSAYGNLGPYLDYFRTATEQGYRRVNPTHFPATLPNFFATEISRAFTLWGSCTALGSGVSAGLEAIGYAADAVRHGGEEAMLAGGVDELNPGSEVAALRANANAGEGIALVLLQTLGAAQASGRPALAEVAGGASARGVSGSDGVLAASAAVRRALDQAGLAPEDVGVVFPSGVDADPLTAALLAELFGARPDLSTVRVARVTGDCFAAAGALQCLAAVASLASNAAPGDARVALIWAAGLDGTFATLVIRRPRSDE